MKKISLLILILNILYIPCLKTQWQYEFHAANDRVLLQISVVDSTIAWVVGRIGETQDISFIYERIAPNIWTEIYGEFMYYNRLTCIAGIDSLTAFVGTDLGIVFRTTDNGNSWDSIINTGGTGYINDIKFSRTNPNFGYIFCDPPQGPGTAFKIYKTTDRGLTWNVLSPVFGGTYYGTERSSCVTDSLHAWYGLNCQPSFCGIAKIAHTTNGGLNWFTSSISGSNYVLGMAFREDNQFGLCGPGDQQPTIKIYRTQNNGANWSIIYNTMFTFPVTSICYAMGTSVWYFCSLELNSQIYKSSDNGTSWYTMEAPQGEQFYFIDAVNQNNKLFAFCVTYQGSILKLVDTAFAIGINNKSNEVPNQFSLSQNYPNPFNPTTKIRFDIPPSKGARGMIAKLVVFDVLGREVAVLVNQQLTPGTYEVDFDGANYPSEVYFYRLEAGSYVETKKMVLLK